MRIIFFLVIILFSSVSLCKSLPSFQILEIDFIDNLPFVVIEVENKKAKVLLDTGARNQVIVLKEEIISQLNTLKLFPKKEKSSDITGKEFIAEKYILPQFNLGPISFLQVRVTKDTNWGLSEGNSTSVLNSKDGAIGLELFTDKAIILDYPNKKLVVLDGKYPEEYDIDNWQDIGFKVDRYGLSVYLSIDYNKTKRFILDSGANISLIKNNEIGISEVKDDCSFSLMKNNSCNYIETKNLLLKNFELTNMKLFLYEFPKDFEPDGIVGYDFLEDKIVYIDFDKRIMRMKTILK